MLRAALLSLALFAPTSSYALCDGPSFWDGLTSAQQSDLETPVANIPFSTGNLWRATKESTTLTIMGTLHLPDPRQAAIFDRLRPALENADLLLVEATKDDQIAMQTELALNPELITLQGGPSLPDRLDATTWNAIRAAAAARGIPGFIAAKMQPWFLSLTLSIPPCATESMASGDAGLDNMLIEAALDQGITIAPLEAWQDMFAVLSSGTFEEQLDALRLGLIDSDLQDSLTVTLMDFYFSERTAMGWYIADFTKEHLPPEAAVTFDEQMAELEQTLLIERNANWIPVIEDAARRHDTVFIAFGAAHLFGEHGVLSLLETKGWTISRQ